MQRSRRCKAGRHPRARGEALGAFDQSQGPRERKAVDVCLGESVMHTIAVRVGKNSGNAATEVAAFKHIEHAGQVERTVRCTHQSIGATES